MNYQLPKDHHSQSVSVLNGSLLGIYQYRSDTRLQSPSWYYQHQGTLEAAHLQQKVRQSAHLTKGDGKSPKAFWYHPDSVISYHIPSNIIIDCHISSYMIIDYHISSCIIM